MPTIQLAKAWWLKLEHLPAIAHYLLAVGLGNAALILGFEFHHPLLPCLAATFLVSSFGEFGPGIVVSLIVLAGGEVIGGSLVPSLDFPEIAIACLGLAYIISKARQLSHANITTENKFIETRLILDRIPVAVWAASPDGRTFVVNNWLLKYTGLDRDCFEDKDGTYSERAQQQAQLHPEDRDRVIEKWLAVRESANHYEDEFRMQRKDGAYLWFKAVGEPKQDEHGKNIQWFGALVDIDRQKHIEAELRRTEDDLRLIIETIPAFVWCAGPNGENFYVNQRLLEYTGATAEDFKGEGWARFLHPDDVALTNVAWSKALETGAPYEWSYRMRRSDGVYEWFSVLAQLLRDKSGAPLRWYGVDFNVDAQKRAEETLNETQARLTRSAQFATVAEFAAAIAHEVTQPLFGANMNVEACLSWLSANPPNIDRARESAATAIEDGKDAAKVIQKVRSLFRKSEPSREPLDVHLAINEVIRLMKDELARRRTSIEVKRDAEIPLVSADRLQIQQVMWNLIHNAADAMDELPSERSILVEIRLKGSSELVVSVSDRGSGFAHSERAFEAFFTTKTNGMGMGLSICRSIVDAHGGRLEVKPNLNVGTTLSFSIPTMPTLSE